MNKFISGFLGFFDAYAPVIIGVCLVICAITILIKKRKEVFDYLTSDEMKRKIIEFILKAEKDIVGTKKGQERLEWCCEQIIAVLPDSIKKFATKEMLVKVVNNLFETIAKRLDSGETKAIM